MAGSTSVTQNNHVPAKAIAHNQLIADLSKGILPGWPYQEPTVTLSCPAHWFGAFYVVLLCKLFALWGILQNLGPGVNKSQGRALG